MLNLPSGSRLRGNDALLPVAGTVPRSRYPVR
jgi:hypothetical protein